MKTCNMIMRNRWRNLIKGKVEKEIISSAGETIYLINALVPFLE